MNFKFVFFLFLFSLVRVDVIGPWDLFKKKKPNHTQTQVTSARLSVQNWKPYHPKSTWTQPMASAPKIKLLGVGDLIPEPRLVSEARKSMGYGVSLGWNCYTAPK
jgi:hypothetical protein